ncbi:MAG: hypothetical protein JXQ80_07345 [Bacteroidales bacterium]|nr:hypothetical protein [Bacteroidales bacterium]
MEVPLRILRRMGYKADSQGIINRYIRVEGAWNDHLTHTRQFILKALNNKQPANLAVLGSGWLLDLPLEELAEMSGHVWLYDIVHPAQVKHRISKLPNVTAVSDDITGGTVMQAYEAVRAFRKHAIPPSADDLCQGAFMPAVQPDFVISLNILSQLSEYITDYLQHHLPFSHNEAARLNTLLQSAHLKLLPKGNACLITDVAEKSIDETGRITEVKQLMEVELPEGAYVEKWEWQFDPLGDYKPGCHTLSEVVALFL